jgi:hypothetical protein
MTAQQYVMHRLLYQLDKYSNGPGQPGAIQGLSVLHSKSFLYGAFMGAQRV